MTKLERVILIYLAVLFGVGLTAATAVDFDTFISGRTTASQPYGSGDKFPIIQGGITKYSAGNIPATTSDPQTFSNKTINGANNPLTVLAATQLSGITPIANGGTGLSAAVSGGILCGTASNVNAYSALLTANAPLIGGGAGACPSVGSVTGNTTKLASVTGTTPSGQGGSWDANGNWVANPSAVFTNVAQTFGPQQTFGSVVGKSRSVAGTTDTLDASTASTSDCGGTVLYTSASQITVTMPANGTPRCSIALIQKNAGRVVLTPASGALGPLNSHNFTGTFNAANTVIGLFIDQNVGGSAAEYILTGDGA